LRLVLDADVVIGALDHNDEHHREARRLFAGWRRKNDTVLISAVNLTEVLVAPARDRAVLSVAREAIGALGISVHPPNEVVAVEAARLRGRHAISLPDAYCLATAKHAGSTLVSFDRRLLRAADAERITAL
jgi:predicted nucleic acid-binding protein